MAVSLNKVSALYCCRDDLKFGISSPSSLSLKRNGAEFLGTNLRVENRRTAVTFSSTLPKIESVISRETKEVVIEKARKELEGAQLVASINYKTLTVKQFQELRSRLPESSSLFVCKNRLLQKAIEGTQWEALKPAMKGMNAFLFVHGEEIPAALKVYRDIQKEQKLEDNDYTGAVFEGKFYGPEEFKALETLPTRAELYAKLLGSLKAPASKVVGTIQAPARELVLTLKAYVAKLEEESQA